MVWYGMVWYGMVTQLLPHEEIAEISVLYFPTIGANTMMVTVLAALHEPSPSTISFIKGAANTANTENHSKKLIETNLKRFQEDKMSSKIGAKPKTGEEYDEKKQMKMYKKVNVYSKLVICKEEKQIRKI